MFLCVAFLVFHVLWITSSCVLFHVGYIEQNMFSQVNHFCSNQVLLVCPFFLNIHLLCANVSSSLYTKRIFQFPLCTYCLGQQLLALMHPMKTLIAICTKHDNVQSLVYIRFFYQFVYEYYELLGLNIAINYIFIWISCS